MYTIDKKYCMNSYLTLRYIEDDTKLFKDGMLHPVYRPPMPEMQTVCNSADDIDRIIHDSLSELLRDDVPTAIFLSGGMDSAILATYMPKGTIAYTGRCVAPNANVIDETPRAREFARINGLPHVIVDVGWDDYLNYSEMLMMNRGAPIHSNEPQVYALVMRAKEDGIKRIIFGDNADMAFGGYDGLLSKDWSFDEWVGRYTYVDPRTALKDAMDPTVFYEDYRINGNSVDYIRCMNEKFSVSSTGSYINPFKLGNMEYFDPYSLMRMDGFDLDRIRAGESKYLIRELFKKKYPDVEVPKKIAMPRAMNVWLEHWKGPERNEFLPGCTENMSGEQKWQIFNLEWFLNIIE